MTIKSNTPAHDKDCWRTPLWLFDALDIEFGFWLDSAASDKNALCAHWLTEADDALNSEWVSHGAIWNTFADCYLMLLLLLHVTVFPNPELQFVYVSTRVG